MIARLRIAACRWMMFRDMMREWPLMECVMAYIQVGWAAIAFWDWNLIVGTSHFYSLHFVIHYMAALVMLSGVFQGMAAAMRWTTGRFIGAGLGMWMFLTFMVNINSPLGILLWSALLAIQILLMAVVID